MVLARNLTGMRRNAYRFNHRPDWNRDVIVEKHPAPLNSDYLCAGTPDHLLQNPNILPSNRVSLGAQRDFFDFN